MSDPKNIPWGARAVPWMGMAMFGLGSMLRWSDRPLLFLAGGILLGYGTAGTMLHAALGAIETGFVTFEGETDHD